MLTATMADETYEFCKIFVQAAEPQTVAKQLAALVGARVQSQILELPEAIVEIRKNEDVGLADDFIGWPVTIEIDAEPDATRAAVVSLVSRIVAGLWDAGTAAVAACDYEAELPWDGGLGRLDEGRRERA
jgi:hypothetical protein